MAYFSRCRDFDIDLYEILHFPTIVIAVSAESCIGHVFSLLSQHRLLPGTFHDVSCSIDFQNNLTVPNHSVDYLFIYKKKTRELNI